MLDRHMCDGLWIRYGKGVEKHRDYLGLGRFVTQMHHFYVHMNFGSQDIGDASEIPRYTAVILKGKNLKKLHGLGIGPAPGDGTVGDVDDDLVGLSVG